jgi:hypothetical protein
LRIVGAKNLGAASLGVLRETVGQFIEMRRGVRLDLRDAGAHGFEVDPFISLGAADAVSLRETAQGPCEIGIVERFVDRVLEFLAH